MKKYLKMHNYTFEEVKNESAKGRDIVARLYRNNYGDIYEAYDKPSARKVKAWRDIKAFAQLVKGSAYITGRNSSTYSAIVKSEKYIYFFTACNQYAVKIGE